MLQQLLTLIEKTVVDPGICFQSCFLGGTALSFFPWVLFGSLVTKLHYPLWQAATLVAPKDRDGAIYACARSLCSLNLTGSCDLLQLTECGTTTLELHCKKTWRLPLGAGEEVSRSVQSPATLRLPLSERSNAAWRSQHWKEKSPSWQPSLSCQTY